MTIAELPDRIHLEGLVFYGFHGVHPEERKLGQRFVVDLTLEADLHRAAQSDDLTHTTNYSTVYRAVQQVVEGDSAHLLETLAERIAAAALAASHASAVRVRVAKPWAPIQGSATGTVAVEIVRRRAPS